MIDRKTAERSVWALIGAGLAWPSFYGAVAYAAASPLERALLSSWCGASAHGSGLVLLGHCANCWTGTAAFLAAAALVAFFSRRQVRPAAA